MTVDNARWRCSLRARAIPRYFFGSSIHAQFSGNFLFLPLALIIELGPVLRSRNSSLWLLLIASYVYGLFTSTLHSFLQSFIRIFSPFCRWLQLTILPACSHCKRDSLKRLLGNEPLFMASISACQFVLLIILVGSLASNRLDISSTKYNLVIVYFVFRMSFSAMVFSSKCTFHQHSCNCSNLFVPSQCLPLTLGVIASYRHCLWLWFV